MNVLADLNLCWAHMSEGVFSDESPDLFFCLVFVFKGNLLDFRFLYVVFFFF